MNYSAMLKKHDAFHELQRNSMNYSIMLGKLAGGVGGWCCCCSGIDWASVGGWRTVALYITCAVYSFITILIFPSFLPYQTVFISTFFTILFSIPVGKHVNDCGAFIWYLSAGLNHNK